MRTRLGPLLAGWLGMLAQGQTPGIPPAEERKARQRHVLLQLGMSEAEFADLVKGAEG